MPQSDNISNDAIKQIESMSEMLDDLDKQIRKNKDTLQKRMSELNAKAEKLRKEIERTKQPGSAG